MSKGKSTFVTILIAAMLLVISIGLYLIWKPGFFIISGVFAGYGYFNGFCDFRSWLSETPSRAEDPVPPDVVSGTPIEDLKGDFKEESFNAIMDEILGGNE